MPSAYLAISYKCNQRCSFCPLTKEESRLPFVEFENIKRTIDGFVAEKHIDTIVLSGGEPSIHPSFIDILAYTTRKYALNTVILSNGERYYDDRFLEQVKSCADISKITAITTIHSHIQEEHELVNGSAGSFIRSTEGLKKLNELGAEVIIKHCITVSNYKGLLDFYKYISRNFDESVTIQLCSIDYCGMEQNELNDNMMSFVELRPYLEEMFDAYITNKENGSERYLYAINMPFCSCDPYYWDILTPKAQTYSGYGAPDDNGDIIENLELENNVGTFFKACEMCAAEPVCPGTYKTAFEYYGNALVKPYERQED